MRYPFILFVLFVLVTTARAQAAGADARAEDAAAKLLAERMKTARPADYALLKAAQGKDIVVVQGSMDHIESVLAAAKVPFTLLAPEAVAGADLNAEQIVMVNCPGTMPDAGVKRLERFVRAGGTLYTTDWALANVVEKAFPKTIAFTGIGTGDHVTAVSVKRADDNIMTNTLLRKDSEPQWWLEGGSYPIRILDQKKVEVLAESAEMAKLYGAAAVVVRFPWHDGQVIHVVSHFYRQAETRGPAVAAATAIEQATGLTAAQKQQLAATAGDIKASELESSYAFQQMTGNIVVNKARENQKLDQVYAWENNEDLVIEGRAVPKGSRLKVLERKGAKVQVRDDRGYEAWLDQETVVVR